MSRHPARLACLPLLALAAAACAGAGDAPRHAFRQIARALETGDRALFHEYVDVESVVATGLDDVVQRHLRKDAGLEQESALAAGLVQATRPLLGALVRARVDEALADPDRRRPARRGRILSVRGDGDRTVTRVEVRTRSDEPVQLDVVLAPFNGHLRVVEVDLAALMDELEAGREGSAPDPSGG